MTKFAVPMGESPSCGGVSCFYKLSEPFVYDNWFEDEDGCAEYVVADFSYTIDCGDETMVFACDENGVISCWHDLYVSSCDDVSNHAAIEAMGYVVKE